MKVLVVDDEPDILAVLAQAFEEDLPGVTMVEASDGARALSRSRQGDISVIVTDLRMPGLDGEALLQTIRRERPHTPVLIMSAHGTIEKAVSMLHAGARDFITKPFGVDDLTHRVRLALETVRLQQELATIKQALEKERKGGQILFAAERMRQLLDRAALVAKSAAPVLITGESGTGKELLAREIHAQGPRRDRPFVAVNCAAFTESLLEAELFGYQKGAFTGAVRDSAGVIQESDTGTLFLDEVGETSLNFQVKLLRFLQEGEIRPVGKGRATHVDTRVIAATNQELKGLLSAGRFREDLYYRLNVIPMHIPPLRDRPEDILLLAQHFLRRYGQEVGRELSLSPGALQALMEHPWPGNVRQLENKIRQLVVLAPRSPVEAEDLDLEGSRTRGALPHRALGYAPGLSFKEAKQAAVDRFERGFLEALLERNRGMPTRASEEAGIDRKNLWRLLKKHDIEPGDFRR